MTMKISVIIPAYNAAATICRAIDSVLAQSVPVHEVIVIDDGSPDDQAEVIESTYGDRVILVRQPNGKTAKARNAGLDRATGDLIAFLDADDYWEPHKLQRQLSVFEQYPEVALVAGNAFDESPGEGRRPNRPRKPERLLFDRVLRLRGERAFHLATLVWTGMVVVRRSAIGTERFVSGLEPAEDRDFWVRIVKQYPSYLLSEPLATAVLQPGSISRSGPSRDCSSMLTVVERNADLLGRRGTRLWKSHTLYRWAALEPDPWTAIPRLFQSFLLWPMPYGNEVGCRRLGRTKRLLKLATHCWMGKARNS
jgi:glycosyltransferase involved in cell wall biosynthesis